MDNCKPQTSKKHFIYRCLLLLVLQLTIVEIIVYVQDSHNLHATAGSHFKDNIYWITKPAYWTKSFQWSSAFLLLLKSRSLFRRCPITNQTATEFLQDRTPSHFHHRMSDYIHKTYKKQWLNWGRPYNGQHNPLTVTKWTIIQPLETISKTIHDSRSQRMSIIETNWFRDFLMLQVKCSHHAQLLCIQVAGRHFEQLL